MSKYRVVPTPYGYELQKKTWCLWWFWNTEYTRYGESSIADAKIFFDKYLANECVERTTAIKRMAEKEIDFEVNE